jgi:hypothetical protein
MKNGDLGMPIHLLVETMTEVTTHLVERINSVRSRNESESTDILTSATDILLLSVTLYQSQQASVAYLSEDNLSMITGDQLLLDLR